MTTVTDPAGRNGALPETGTLVLDGRVASTDIRRRCTEEVQALTSRHSILPGLAVLRVGDDPASISYAGRITKSFESVGLTATVFTLPSNATRSMLQSELDRLNGLAEFAGILVQSPLPAHLDWGAVIEVLNPAKDVDGTHPVNVGRLALGLDCFVPATPLGGVVLLDYYSITAEGKRALVIGRSGIVGRPLSQLLLARNATVTIAHSRSRDMAGLVGEADIVASATGKPGLVKGSMLKSGAVVLDFGVSVVDGQIKGDVDYESAFPVAGAITPVPGGTGPMTNAVLIQNTLKAIQRSFSKLG